MTKYLSPDWRTHLDLELSSSSFHCLKLFLEHQTHQIFPNKDTIFNAFNMTPFDSIKVVILGQDPYHDKNQANGLAFSVSKGVKIPPSLANIYKELVSDIDCATPVSGDLSPWAKQGVLLLNTVLTVQAHKANSHRKKGWEGFTSSVISKISDKKTGCVFILWGKPAQSKKKLIDETKHLVIESPHPSPLSCYRGFWGSKPFSKTNTYLQLNGSKPIDWCL